MRSTGVHATSQSARAARCGCLDLAPSRLAPFRPPPSCTPLARSRALRRRGILAGPARARPCGRDRSARAGAHEAVPVCALECRREICQGKAAAPARTGAPGRSSSRRTRARARRHRRARPRAHDAGTPRHKRAAHGRTSAGAHTRAWQRACVLPAHTLARARARRTSASFTNAKYEVYGHYLFIYKLYEI
jgi:hypothetical protein